MLREKAFWCRAQCGPLNTKLQSLKNVYQQAATLIQLLDRYEAGVTSLPQKKQRCIEEQRYQAEKKKVQNGWAEQKLLEVRIATLEQEAELYEAVSEIK